MRALLFTRSLLLTRRRRFILFAVLVALALALVGGSELGPMARSVANADWRWAGVAVGLMLVSLTLRSGALMLIARACGCDARLRDTFSSTSIGLLANAAVPVRVGSLLNPYVLYLLVRRRGSPLPFATTLGMTITEQLFSAGTFVLFGLTVASLLAAPAWAVPALIGCGAGLGVLFALAIIVQVRRGQGRVCLPVMKPAVGTGLRHRAWDALRVALPHFVDSQRVLARPWLAVLVGLVQAAALLVQLAAAVAVLHAFHLGGAGWQGAALVLLLTNLIGILPLTPGNVGTFQLAATAALAASGVPAGPALAFALGLQGLGLLVGVSAGLASLSFQGLSLGDLTTRTRHAAEALGRAQPAPAPVVPPAGG